MINSTISFIRIHIDLILTIVIIMTSLAWVVSRNTKTEEKRKEEEEEKKKELEKEQKEKGEVVSTIAGTDMPEPVKVSLGYVNGDIRISYSGGGLLEEDGSILQVERPSVNENDWNVMMLDLKGNAREGMTNNQGKSSSQVPLTKTKEMKMTNLIKSDFCNRDMSNHNTIHKKCGALSEAVCNKTSCCTFVNGKTVPKKSGDKPKKISKCMGGSVGGPTYNKDGDVRFNVDYYFYQNRCYGNGCPMKSR